MSNFYNFDNGNSSYSWTTTPTYQQILETTKYYYKRKEDDMTTLQKVHKERTEAAERKKIEAAYTKLDALKLDDLIDGSVIRFNIEESNSKVYTYAALHADNRWWVTGATAPNGVPLEDLLAWMIRRNVILESVVKL